MKKLTEARKTKVWDAIRAVISTRSKHPQKQVNDFKIEQLMAAEAKRAARAARRRVQGDAKMKEH